MKYLVFFLLIVQQAYACECIGKANLKTSIKTSNVIIDGVVIEEHRVDGDSLIDIYTEYVIKVNMVYKGVVKHDTIKVYTGLGDGDCGFRFVVGRRYIIYSIHSEYYQQFDPTYFLYTDICTRTMEYSDSERKKIFRSKTLLKSKTY